MNKHPSAAAAGLRIAIAGAGLSGLALAQGLRRHGIVAQLYERDAGPSARRQGYRLRIDSAGQAALREALGREGLARWLAACAPALPLASHDVQLNNIATPWTSAWERAADGADASPDLRADRGLLREALMEGLDEQLHWGSEVVACQQRPDGSIALRLADGRRAACDLLVVANGAHSALYRPRWSSAPEAVASCVYGRSGLAGAWLSQLPGDFLSATRVIVDRQAVAIIDAMRFAAGSRVPDYLYWALLLPEAGADLGQGPLLREQLLRMCQHWAAPMRAMLMHTEPAAIRAVSVFSGGRVEEAEPVEAVEAGLPMVAIGDALHLMSPAGGLGANTALQDAADLAQTLATLDQPGATALGAALARYKQRLSARANAAMARSDASHQQLCQFALTQPSNASTAAGLGSMEAPCN
ncbi:FAD-dependent monooxygenase [Paucibacter sp. APW11]|uniref:FAD-dependent monooxygenase n=1 Tax=Roseateles aquae TaxID=3077235 RepID=A0ABU3PDW7_9BURK|nr:FAD-dependent monooxygenase [Paucibacter sp. APW11]MDT9000322.1 FAD-dependent monooxygenase [Paucibacter sp. APW11]